MSFYDSLKIKTVGCAAENPRVAQAIANFTLRELYQIDEPEQAEVTEMLSSIATRLSTAVAYGPTGKLVAVAGLEVSHEPYEATIVDVATRTSHRKRGLGRKVIEHVEQSARNRGAITLDVYPLTSARGFYEKLGYRPQADRYVKTVMV